MIDRERLKKAWSIVKPKWPVAARALALLGLIVVGFNLPAPVWMDSAAARQFLLLARLVVVALASLVMVLARLSRGRLSAWIWLALSSSLIIVYISSYFMYSGFQERYVRDDVEMNGMRELIVLGDQPANDQVKQELKESYNGRMIPDMDKADIVELMFDFPPPILDEDSARPSKRVGQICDPRSIDHVRGILAIGYMATAALFALVVGALTESLCAFAPRAAVRPLLHLRGGLFLSYRRADSGDATDRIREHLAARFTPIFVDVDSINPGQNFEQRIEDSLKNCDVVLAIIGPDWLSLKAAGDMRRIDEPGDYVKLEIERAMARGVPVIPVLVNDSRMPSAGELPQSLRGFELLQGVWVRRDPYFRDDIRRLCEAIEHLVGADPGGVSAPPPETEATAAEPAIQG